MMPYSPAHLSRSWLPRPHLLRAGLWLVLVFVIAACTPKPTPYQPLAKNGGYEETRLKEKVYRVSFKGNRYTDETAVLDYLYLRCAELTRDAGYTHFLLSQDYGKIQATASPRSQFSIGMGFSSGIRRTGLGVGAGFPLSQDYRTTVNYHLGVFVIHLLSAEEAAQQPDALEADYLLKSINEKIRKAAKPAS